MTQATLRLFKALPITKKETKMQPLSFLEKTIRKGFIISPEVIANYPANDILIKLIESEIGLTPEQINASFHKSWLKVQEASIEQLVMEQIMHYFTTYGFQSLGVYNDSTVYIPHEQLDIPELTDDLKLVLIKGYTWEELKEKLLKLLQSGIALKEDTMNDIVTVAELVGLTVKEIDSIKNKEVKVQLYDRLNKIPENPTEFLRYVIYKTTKETLLIKNKNLINKIKESDAYIYPLFLKYDTENGLAKLSTIFYRFKPLFLAFKKDESVKPLINMLRKLEKTNHKPMSEDYLNSITGKIKNNKPLSKKELLNELSKVNIFRKIRLANALNYRVHDTNAILYKVRNGNGYA